MAAVLRLPTVQGPSRDDADAGVAAALAYVSDLDASSAMPLLQHYRRQFEALEAAKLAETIDDDGSTKAAEKLAGHGNSTTRRSRKAAVKRAAAVKGNPDLADKMANHELSGEQVELLADAARKVGDQALTDSELIARLAAVDPDQGKQIVADYVAANTTSDQAETRYRRQRRKRKLTRFVTGDGQDALLALGDRETIDAIWLACTRRANDFYRQDGDRNVPHEQHPRTADQRRFDALAAQFGSDATNTAAGSDQGRSNSRSVHNNAPSIASDMSVPCSDSSQESTADPAASSTVDCVGSPRAGAANSRRHTPKVSTTTPTIVVTLTLEKYLGLAPEQAAIVVGSGPIADSVLAQYIGADANTIGLLFGHDGQPLWLGRNVRFASKAQMMALIIRDKGCVLCSAHFSSCQAHHTMPWNAPGKGQTNIDEMVLVCGSCHHRIHDEKQTIYHHASSGNWKLRPALRHEIAPPRTPDPSKGQMPQRI